MHACVDREKDSGQGNKSIKGTEYRKKLLKNIMDSYLLRQTLVDPGSSLG
jgi:hypothetical protein